MSCPSPCMSYVLNSWIVHQQNALYRRRAQARNVQTACAKDSDCIRFLFTFSYRSFMLLKFIFISLQPEILGLRYISRSRNPRWVDLSRPLKRQLDKYSCHFSLYLRVMYYVSDVKFIKDEITRLVYLQLIFFCSIIL